MEEPKTTCKNCNEEILVATAKRTKGYCMSCTPKTEPLAKVEKQTYIPQ